MKTHEHDVRAGVIAPPSPTELLDLDFASGGNRSPIAVLMELFRRYGDVVHYSTRFNEFFLVNHPALAKEVLGSHDYIRSPILKTILGNGLLAADGPYWERQRRVMLPEFRPARIERLVDTFRDVALERAATWTAKAQSGEPLNLNREMEHIALSSVGRALFGAEIDDRFLDAFAVAMQELGALGNAADFGFPLIRRADSNRRFQEAMNVVEESVGDILAADSNGRPNLLTVLRTKWDGNSPPLSERQLRDEVVTMITAGHETTAVTLAWVWYALLCHDDVAERFYEEIDRVIGDRPILAADLPRLVYTRKVIDETLRLYPPVWLVGRTALRNDFLGGYEIPANAGVLVSPFVIHRHPEFWPEPERFDPERFATEKDREVDAYLPFLSGRHLCIGKHFALMEAVVVLATIAQRFRFRRTSTLPIDFEPLVSLRMRGSLTVNVQSRRPRRNQRDLD